MNEIPEWTTAEKLGNLAAAELAAAMTQLGINYASCAADPEDGTVGVVFDEIRDAETLLTLSVDGTQGVGSLNDRVSEACLTLQSLNDDGLPLHLNPAAMDAVKGAWNWTIHPSLRVRRMRWHVAVDMPVADANQVTANLNTLRLGAL